MRKFVFIFILIVLAEPIISTNKKGFWEVASPFLKVAQLSPNSSKTFVHDPLLYMQKWDTLAQLVFWRSVMNLPADSALLSIHGERRVLERINSRAWEDQEEEDQESYRDSLRRKFELDSATRILFTTGKSDFYDFEASLSSIEMGIKIFKEQCVEPWYAQTILLIESPGKLDKSPAGALGSFQLMKSVARKYGLVVNKYQDDRKDFEKSAVAASRLISEICIPETKKILDELSIKYHESDLWFRLLVLHVYHAGAANVKGVLMAMNPKKGGKQLITTLWRTEHGRFKNASQNYSQVALASNLELDRMIRERGKRIYWVEN